MPSEKALPPFERKAGSSHRIMKKRRLCRVLDSSIDVISWDTTIDRIMNWAFENQSRYICICNVHSIVTARNNRTFNHIIENADMATPDGMPVVWLMRCLGYKKQVRINGPDLLWRLCRRSAEGKISLYFYGGSQETLDKLRKRLKAAFPQLDVVGMVSPPFHKLNPEETASDIRAINESGAGIVFVCLGCPKQERWMAKHRENIRAVTIGVGAAFSYHAGTLKRAPLWMQKCGLEWLFRLAAEPNRLWRRYFTTNSQFIIGSLIQLITQKKGSAIKG
jgi:N-acetylglucosaminyldiphosphoundecaprenol N-acetyl-beta-D-mannosaminyltransferase